MDRCCREYTAGQLLDLVQALTGSVGASKERDIEGLMEAIGGAGG